MNTETTFEDLLATLRPYKGQFVRISRFGGENPEGPLVRHKSRRDTQGALACPLAVLCEDTGTKIANFSFHRAQTLLRIDPGVRRTMVRAADNPDADFRQALEEAIL